MAISCVLPFSNESILLRRRMRQLISILALLLIISELSVADVQVEKTLQLSSNRAFFSTVQADNKLYFVGGYEHSDYIASDRIDVLNLESGSWETPLNLSTPRGYISSIVIGPRIYMAGGVDYTCAPYQYSWDYSNFTTNGASSGPTVRRPVRLALHDTTLTVIGYYAVNFMDTTTKKWTHNEQLSRVMSQVFDSTTISHRNFVFVIGGTNITSQQQVTSVWVLDSPSSTPEEFHDKVSPVSSSMFVSSWFDNDHSAVVIHFSNQCLVYHTSTRTWFQRESNNNSISSESFQNSTMVFFSDGYWTIDWYHMTDTWTSLDQITFAFTISDQVVLLSSQQMTIVTPSNITTQPIEVGPIAMSTAMSTSIHVLVSANCTIFMYYADTQDLQSLDIGNYASISPLSGIFRSNDSHVHIFVEVSNRQYLYSLNASGIAFQGYAPMYPSILLNDRFIDPHYGYWFTTTDLILRYMPQTFQSPVWIQEGDQLYLMQGSSFSGTPAAYIGYQAVDVYNYVESKWEDSIVLRPLIYPGRFLPVAELDGVLTAVLRNSFLQLNSSNEWSRQSVPILIAPSLHPTYTPPPVINNAMYLSQSSALVILNSNSSRRTASGAAGATQQLVSSNSKVIQSTKQSTYSNVAIYDSLSDTWEGVLFESGQLMVSIVMYEGVLLAFGDDTESFSYLDIATLAWTKQPFNNTHVPASMFTLQSQSNDNKTVLVIAGGYHRTSQHYTDEVKFVTLDIESAPLTNTPLSSAPTNQSPDDSTVVIAVVVPVVVVAAAAAVLLAILLVRRKQQRRRMQSTTIGLEQKFNQWFVPFSDIQFGAQLGQGANGQVFKGKWKSTDVALKVSMTQANQSVIGELSLMINMRPHPNVVQLLGFSVHPETSSIILLLEFCDGGSLDTMLYQSGELFAIKKKLFWLKSIAKGLSHLHSNNIVHRDLAARNVLLHQGEPKLTDFGMSRIVDEEQQRGTTKSELGPIRWMSPESLSLKQYSTKSDVWSFGIVMFEVLAQQEPHVDEDPIEVGRKIRDEGLTPQLPSSLECRSEFTSIMNQCCAVDANSRPNIEQVLQKLEQIPCSTEM